MPGRYAVRLAVQNPPVTDARLRGLVSGWLERGYSLAAHHRNLKGFTISPARNVDGPHLVEFEIGLLDDHLRSPMELGAARALAGLPHAHRCFHPADCHCLRGRVVPAGGSPARSVAGRSWAHLRAAGEPALECTLWFLTPTLFRRGDQAIPWPFPERVFGHYRRRWREFDPEGEPRVSFHEVAMRVLEGPEATVWACNPYGSFPAFTGKVRFGFAGADGALRALNRLAHLAEFCGTGSFTILGCGVTRYEALPA